MNSSLGLALVMAPRQGKQAKAAATPRGKAAARVPEACEPVAALADNLNDDYTITMHKVLTTIQDHEAFSDILTADPIGIQTGNSVGGSANAGCKVSRKHIV